MSVDSHAHTFLHSLPMVPNRRYTPDYDAPLAGYLAMLDSGIVFTLVLVFTQLWQMAAR